MTTRPPKHTVEVGLLAPPQIEQTLVEGIAEDLSSRLCQRAGDALDWRIHVVRDTTTPDTERYGDALPIGPDGKGVGEAFDSLTGRLHDEGWDMLVALTDMPLRDERRPLVARVSKSKDIAILSVPALGALRRGAHEGAALAALSEAMIDEVSEKKRVPGVGQLILADPAGPNAMQLMAPRLRGHLRVIAGMVLANRPWRIAVKLSYMLAAAAAAAALAMMTFDTWTISDALDALHLTALTAASIAIMITWLIIVHSLWERPSEYGGREQAALFNVVTVLTLGVGVFALYVMLLLLTFVGGIWIIKTSVLEQQLQHPASFGNYVRVAWLSASLGTIGGAIGSGLEKSVDIRAAAYSYNPERGDLREDSK